jgi:two-component system phosphate regulon sensor histidine kinase PhoR
MAKTQPPDDAAALDRLSARDLAAVIPDPVIMVDGRGAVRYANEAAVAAFGVIPRGTVLAHRFRTPDMQRLLGALLGEGRSGAVEYGERVPMERAFRVSAMPLGAGSGLFMLHFKDQSETRRIDRMRADFIANASHELRTPLASISGFIETLRGPARDDARARDSFLQIMQAQTERMARLIDDLLALSRIEMKPRLPAREKVELGETVAGVVDTLSHHAASHGVEVVFARPAEPVFVSGSRDELIQVFVNLLENACKYGEAGGRVDITIERGHAGPVPEVAVTFRDYGPGIAEEHIPRITERFYRIEDGKGRAKSGTGLGLAIVKHILTRHEGRLVVRSKPGEGASFIVHLPAR